MSAPLKDGVGRAVVGDNAYFIQAIDKGGDCAWWWKPNGYGYTVDVDEAGVFLGHEVPKHVTDRDRAWPVDWVRARQTAHVHLSNLRRGAPRTG